MRGLIREGISAPRPPVYPPPFAIADIPALRASWISDSNPPAVGTPSAGVPYIQTLKMEPAIRIERTTCSLRISDNPISDNLTPQETTNQDAPDMGPDGTGLSCPGSSEVADEDGGKMVRLIQI